LLGDERAVKARGLADKVVAAKTDSSRAQAILDEILEGGFGLEDISWCIAFIAADAACGYDRTFLCDTPHNSGKTLWAGSKTSKHP
jgi:hypothetical protein